jgi:hypothetical protein
MAGCGLDRSAGFDMVDRATRTGGEFGGEKKWRHRLL